MLLRFVAENIFSFKDVTEFNTFPSSKSHSLVHHKIDCSHTTALRLAAVYGANGAGKSNLLSAMNLLREFVLSGSLDFHGFNEGLAFRFDPSCLGKASGMAIEFCRNDKVFYYHIEFKGRELVLEELLLSKKTKDIPIIQREGGNIKLNGDFLTNGVNDEFLNALDRLVRPDMLLFSFLGQYYHSESELVAEAYSWFADLFRVVLPDTISGHVPHLFDKYEPFRRLVNETIPELKTGISALRVRKVVVTDELINGNKDLISVVSNARNHPDEPQIVERNNGLGVSNVIFEDGQVWQKTLVSVHEDTGGNTVEVPVSIESDGTRRLIEYMPLFFALTHGHGVFVVDEIERSVHPIMVKSIIQKISDSKQAKSQLIFTTHESCLLDQSIFRPDEIWFAQKDAEQSTKLYPLSDFNIHNTANIENGYLAGRYGGIPFLSNLKDLHW